MKPLYAKYNTKTTELIIEIIKDSFEEIFIFFIRE